jgi:glutamyl-tRNA reductase
MRLRLVGCSHHQSSVEIRERLAFTPDQVHDALKQLQVRYPDTETVLLSTCNRVELYVAGERSADVPEIDQLMEFLAEYHGLDRTEVSGELFAQIDQQAVRHLFLVAASLDSMVVGEAQILSQVKQAFLASQEEQAAGPLTHHIFETAYRVAKRVARETQINRRRVSIPSVAVADYAKQMFETFADKRILLIGAGEMGEETLRYLRDEGAREIVILNRSRQRADDLAAKLNASTDDWENLENRIVWADLIVSTTGAREPIVTPERFEEIEKERDNRILFVLDLAVPRDWDPAISQFPDVYLYCIDDLQAVCEKNRKAREKEWPRAEKIVDEETVRFMTERNHRVTAPTIQRLQQQAEQLKSSELRRLLNKLGSIDDRARDEITRSFDRLVNKLLHPPLESLRDEAKKGSPHGLLDALRHLFQISD